MKPEERPEFYANNNLRKALKFDPSPESVHDTRVYLRKYLTILNVKQGLPQLGLHILL